MRLKDKSIFTDVCFEYTIATLHYGKFASAHEGFAILKEEVDELWDAVRLKQSDPARNVLMRKEAIQVAAMAIRFIHDVSGEEL